MTFKPYVKKPLVHSPLGQEVLANVTGFLIRTRSGEAITSDPGQALAALSVARKHGRPCNIYAVGEAYGLETIELVDEGFLAQRVLTKDAIASMDFAEVEKRVLLHQANPLAPRLTSDDKWFTVTGRFKPPKRRGQ